jgi:hypothetical protein
MAPSEYPEIALQVSILGEDESDMSAAHIPGPSAPGVPLDPGQVSTVVQDDDAPDYADAGILRAGDSTQSYVGTHVAGQDADVPDSFGPGETGGYDGGE